ncbi:hypothetical protein KUCAC02_035226 [Chaenocephalus aceratus]|nr:hypothetical protein KUCAC02_035226 [Chaenocephalus aceratus]
MHLAPPSTGRNKTCSSTSHVTSRYIVGRLASITLLTPPPYLLTPPPYLLTPPPCFLTPLPYLLTLLPFFLTPLPCFYS